MLVKFLVTMMMVMRLMRAMRTMHFAIRAVISKKIPSEMEVAPRYNC